MRTTTGNDVHTIRLEETTPPRPRAPTTHVNGRRWANNKCDRKSLTNMRGSTTIYSFLFVFFFCKGTWFDWFLWSRLFVGKKHPIREIGLCEWFQTNAGWVTKRGPPLPPRLVIPFEYTTFTKNADSELSHSNRIQVPDVSRVGRTCKEESLAKNPFKIEKIKKYFFTL